MKRITLILTAAAFLSGAVALSAQPAEAVFSIKKVTPFFSDVVATWVEDPAAEAYDVTCNGRTDRVKGTRWHGKGLKMDTEYTLSIRRVVGGEASGEALEKTFRTGYIRQFTGRGNRPNTANLGPTHVTVEFANVCGADRKTPGYRKVAYQVQLFESEDTEAKPVYSLYTYDGHTNNNGCFAMTTFAGKKNGKGMFDYPYRLSFGRLQPDHTYYFRIRTVKDVTINNYYYKEKDVSDKPEGLKPATQVNIGAPYGESAFSELVPLKTQPAHVMEPGEIIWQGFDELCFSSDYFNLAPGTIPAFRTQSSSMTPFQLNPDVDYVNWKGAWTLIPFNNTYVMEQWNLATRDKFYNGQLKPKMYYKLSFSNFAFGPKTPSLMDYCCSWYCVPSMGNLKMGGAIPGEKNQYNSSYFSIRPFTKKDGISKKGTRVVLTFKVAASRQVRPEDITIEQYNADLDEVEKVCTVSLQPQITDTQNHSLEKTYVWQTLTAEALVKPYDSLIIFNGTSDYILVDDISVKIK